MNWLERSRNELREIARRRTANSANGTLAAVLAVRKSPESPLRSLSNGSIGSGLSAENVESMAETAEGDATEPLWSDLRPCTSCRHLIGRHCGVERFEPVRDIPRRCESYTPLGVFSGPSRSSLRVVPSGWEPA